MKESGLCVRRCDAWFTVEVTGVPSQGSSTLQCLTVLTFEWVNQKLGPAGDLDQRLLSAPGSD